MNLSDWLSTACYFGQVVAFFIGLILVFRNKEIEFKIWFFLMTIELISETFGHFSFLRKIPFYKTHYFLILNPALIIEMMCYQLLFSVLLKNNVVKKIAFTSMLLNATLFIILSFKVEPIQTSFPIISFCYGAVMSIVFALYYFYEKIQSQEILKFSNTFWNWVFAFLIIFLAVEIPFICIFNYVLSHPDFTKHFSIFVNIKQSVGLLLYLSYLIGFLWMKKK